MNPETKTARSSRARKALTAVAILVGRNPRLSHATETLDRYSPASYSVLVALSDGRHAVVIVHTDRTTDDIRFAWLNHFTSETGGFGDVRIVRSHRQIPRNSSVRVLVKTAAVNAVEVSS